jgi:hypothetical protein
MPQVHGGVSKGRVMVVGSVQMFGDGWIDKEENTAVMRCARRLLCSRQELFFP